MEVTVTAYLGLGSNLGDRLENLRGARKALRKNPAVDISASAALYETAPMGGPERQPSYLNTVLKIRTTLTPERLLSLCLQIEKDFGRQRKERWGPRTLDIDILFFDTVIRVDSDLVLPHPRLHERTFVLCPLVDLDPDIIHPVVDQRVEELLLRLDATEGVQRVAELW
ncbi:MAG: 2-amino-4-hydroxy-6-hydroxymethyldihydropteridine diphosphokinase [Desulfuromonas sp.]|nr:MAG: 2-amino-4-hydroxy-6-hydroxymethyldihydropteridine diphosphokinase [Desulfuromonas sp.]